MNKMRIKPIITLILVLALLVCATACTNGKRAGEEAKSSVSTDISAIEKLFPSLEGATEIEWEQVTLGSGDSRVPGPTDYRFQGYIVLSDDAAQKYASSYDFTEAEPDVTFENIKEREGKWKYSEDFCKDIIPEYYPGSVWIDGNTILFSVTTT